MVSKQGPHGAAHLPHRVDWVWHFGPRLEDADGSVVEADAEESVLGRVPVEAHDAGERAPHALGVRRILERVEAQHARALRVG
eukprot:1997377-Pleurochrysis_carterae.AAC.1